MKIILYDGDCGFCNRCIRFLWKRDQDGQLHYTSIQSATGGEILKRHGIDPPELDTMFFVDGGDLYSRSEAALRALSLLPGHSQVKNLLRIPKGTRDLLYKLVAKYRLQLGRNSSVCELPPTEVRARFLD